MLLHRFLSLSSPGQREQLERALFTSELLFSSPLSFNDPFESRFTLETQGSLEEWRRMLSKPDLRKTAGLPVEGSLTDAMLASMAAFVQQRGGPISEDLREAILGDVAVCCFSERNSHPLMWSHYAAAHRGLCLSFDLSEHKAFQQDTHEVSYQLEFPSVSFYEANSSEAARRVFLTKAQVWEYEAEWRTVLVSAEPGFRWFPPTMLKQITFGAYCSEADRALVAGMCRCHGTPITLRAAIIRPGGFELDVAPYEQA